jgi:hypothetical protein
MLFHVSEEPGIERFDPRASERAVEPAVWAIDAERLRNYLAPRECPRVTYYANGETTAADVERFLGSSTAVVAVENGWLEQLRSCRLYCYQLRFMPNLWPLRDAVVASTLRFSLIRMRNALPRSSAYATDRTAAS